MKMKHTIKRTAFALLFSELFWPDWKTGFGKGEPLRFPRGELVEVTEKGKDKSRVRIASNPAYQAYVLHDCLVAPDYFQEIEVKKISDEAMKAICPT